MVFLECYNSNLQKTSKGPRCPSTREKDQGNNNSLLRVDASAACVGVGEVRQEQKTGNTCDDQSYGNVEPGGVKASGERVSLSNRGIYQANGSQRKPTGPEQGPYDDDIPIIAASLEEYPCGHKDDTEKDSNQA